ncbi:hypothetical protein [Blastopirellula marina]|uniref:Uncharacterized protein n=1 Tax=Blastopirellula marina TaxID=124 RepID=A0A2S8GU84_9BACT|nr:hypothetical protein [Blastopirellula marina]PQO47966.1 hypothetical protein C5Y93_00840 [Blastopirellula marina]
MTKLRHWLSLILAPLGRRKWLLLVSLLATSYYAVKPANGFLPGYWLAHGWPLQCISRESNEFKLSPWIPFTRVTEFHLGPLLFNLTIAAAISLSLVYAWHWHCERNGSWRRFDLKELLLITLLLATGIGLTLRWRSQIAANEKYVEQLQEIGWFPFGRTPIPPWCLQPQYDAGLLGRQAWYHTFSLAWSPEQPDIDINRQMIEIVNRGETLPLQVFDLECDDPRLTDEGLAAISRWAPHCESLFFQSQASFSHLGLAEVARNMPRLNRLTLWSENLTDESIAEIGQMKNLTYLVLDDIDQRSHRESLEYLKKLPRLKDLQSPKHWVISQADQDEFARRGVRLRYFGE